MICILWVYYMRQETFGGWLQEIVSWLGQDHLNRLITWKQSKNTVQWKVGVTDVQSIIFFFDANAVVFEYWASSFTPHCCSSHSWVRTLL